MMLSMGAAMPLLMVVVSPANALVPIVSAALGFLAAKASDLECARSRTTFPTSLSYDCGCRPDCPWLDSHFANLAANLMQIRESR